MRFDSHDFTIVGAALGAGGAILLAKAYLMPSFPAESAMSFFGSNPFQVRNAITTRDEAIAGCAWLVVGLVLTNGESIESLVRRLLPHFPGVTVD
jgi:hypothetical protein